MIEYLINRARTYEQWRNWDYIRIYVENVPADTAVQFAIYVTRKKQYIVDWGDGQIAEYTGNNNLQYCSHTYSKIYSGYVLIYSNYITQLGYFNNPTLYPYIKTLDGNHRTIQQITLGSIIKCTITTIDITNFPKLSTLMLDRCANLKEIKGLSGTSRKLQLVAGTGKLNGDYDLSLIEPSSKTSFITFNTSGHVKVPVWINRTWRYDTNNTNTQPNLFYLVDCKSYECVFPDGSIVTDKVELYSRIADVVKEEGLYDYPQMNVILPAFTKAETEQLYDVHKVFLCDSGMQNSWQNGHHDVGTIPQNKMWTATKKVTLNQSYLGRNCTIQCKCIFKPGASFYINNSYGGYHVSDNKQRIICDNGVISGINGAEVTTTTLEDGNIESILTIDLIVNGGSYARSIVLYENNPNQEESKIISFEFLQEITE